MGGRFRVPGRIKAQIGEFCEYMLWRITERQVIYILRKRRRKSIKYKRVGNTVSGGNYHDFLRREYGLKREEFEGLLFKEEFIGSFPLNLFGWLNWKLRPEYYQNFSSDLRKVLDEAITKNHIRQSVRNEGTFLREDMEYSRQLLAWYYYPKIILEWEPARDLLSKTIKWVFIFMLGYVGLSAILRL